MTPFGSTDVSRILQEGMRVAASNQRLIANNIANVDTPGYNAVHMDFQKTLRRSLDGRGWFQLRRSDPRHIVSDRYRPALEKIAPLSKNDYNKVSLDEEMVKLRENTGRYTTYGSLLVKRFQVIKGMLNDLR